MTTHLDAIEITQSKRPGYVRIGMYKTFIEVTEHEAQVLARRLIVQALKVEPIYVTVVVPYGTPIPSEYETVELPNE